MQWSCKSSYFVRAASSADELLVEASPKFAGVPAIVGIIGKVAKRIGAAGKSTSRTSVVRAAGARAGAAKDEGKQRRTSRAARTVATTSECMGVGRPRLTIKGP